MRSFDKIFIYDENTNRVTINNPSFLLLSPVQQLIEGQDSFAGLSFLYLYLDPNSVLSELQDDYRMERAAELSKFDLSIVDANVLDEAVRTYKEIILSNKILTYIKDTETLIESITKYCREVDLTETIEAGPQKGKLVHSVAEARRTIKDLPDLIKTAQELRELAKREMENNEGSSKIRGDIEKGLFE